MFTQEKKKWKWSLLFLVLLTALFVCAGCEPVDDDDDDIVNGVNYCLEDISDLRPGRGPFSVSTSTLRISESRFSYAEVKVWYPGNIPSDCKVPVVHLANGTAGRCSMYEPLLENLAEFGFMAACYEDPNAVQGTQAITAVEAVLSTYPHIADAEKIGFTGHAEGGGATFLAVFRAEEHWGGSRKYSGLVIQPTSGFGDSPTDWKSYYGRISSPMSMFNGAKDTLVPANWVKEAFDLLPKDLFKVWYTATGEDSTHIPIPNDPAGEMAVPWFRWTLLGYKDACEAFKALPSQPDWRLAEQANVPSCDEI